MNKSKLREQLKKDLDIFIDSVEQEMQTDEVFLTEGYWFYDDLLNFAEKLVAKNRKAILEEIRSLSLKEFEEQMALALKAGDEQKAILAGYAKGAISRLLSLLEGKMTKQQIAGDYNQKIKQAENDTRSGRTLDGENQVYVDARELYNPEIEKALKEQKEKIIEIIKKAIEREL